jgi:hypothetical protein
MMIYEDFEKTQAKRAAKQTVKDGVVVKGWGRKRKSPVLEAAKAKKARSSEVDIAEDEIAAGRDGGLLLGSPTLSGQ